MIVAHYADFLETIPDGAVVVDAAGTIVMANRKAHRIFQHPEPSLIGTSVHLLMPSSMQERHHHYVGQFFKDPHSRPMGRGLDFLAKRSDDTSVSVDIMLNPIALEGQDYALAVIRDTTERRQMEDRIRAELAAERVRAMTDHLTGLTNRRGFIGILQKEIERFYRYKSPFSVVYFDLDDFKNINDEFGHCEGDNVLRTVARDGYRVLREADTFARMGGDEFAILMPETAEPAAKAAMEHFSNAIAVSMDSNNWKVSLSMGLATFTDLDSGLDAEKILNLADQDMFSSKRDRKRQGANLQNLG